MLFRDRAIAGLVDVTTRTINRNEIYEVTEKKTSRSGGARGRKQRRGRWHDKDGYIKV